MTDGLNRQPRIGEPETPFEAGIQGVKSQPTTITRFLAGEGMPDTSISGPIMLQQPPRWSHDFDENGQSRATLKSIIPVIENPPNTPTPTAFQPSPITAACARCRWPRAAGPSPCRSPRGLAPPRRFPSFCSPMRNSPLGECSLMALSGRGADDE